MRAKVLLTAVLIAVSSASYAALGSAPSTFRAEAGSGPAPKSMKSARANFTVNEVLLETGTRVREYVSNEGVVFAVSWKGQFAPDLRELLGKHFDTMVEERANKPRAGNSQLMVKNDELVIHSRGHMRSMEGVAYLPSKLPAGVALKDIQ